MNSLNGYDRYAQAALDAELATLAGTAQGRNHAANVAGFKIGGLVGAGALDRQEVEPRLFQAAEQNGSVGKHGANVMRATIASGLNAGEKQPRVIPETARASGASRPKSEPATPQTQEPAKPTPKLHDVPIPDWTPPGADGKPAFTDIGKPEPGLLKGEARRHAYRRDGEVVRIKVKLEGSAWRNVYRVVRPSDGAIGWQFKQPVRYVPMPYIGPVDAFDPFDPEHADEVVFWSEGEKDTDTLQRLGLLAFTFGGSSDTPNCTELMRGRDVVIPVDNDTAGEACATRKTEMLQGAAARIRTIRFVELKIGGDVTDWIVDNGADAEALLAQAVDVEAKAPAVETPGPERFDTAGSTSQAETFSPDGDKQTENKTKIEKELEQEDPFPLIWHGDADEAPMREWTVEEMLPKVGTALLSGQWGTYKTFIGFDLSAAVMVGGTFAGRKVKHTGGVLWIAVEGQSEVRIRLAAVAAEKIQPAVNGESVILDPNRLPFAWTKACPKLSDSNALPRFRALVRKAVEEFRKRFDLPLALVVIDTLSPAAEFNDANDTAENQRVMTVLKTVAVEFETVVCAVDHMGKDTSTGTRNSSVKEADVDAVIALLGEKDIAGNVVNPRLAMRKVRGAPTGWEAKFDKRVVTIGVGFEAATTLVVDWIATDTKSDAPKAAKPAWSTLGERILKGVLERALMDHGSEQQPYGLSGPKVKAVPLSKVKAEFELEYPSDDDDPRKAADAKRKAFKRAREGAMTKGLVQTKQIGASLVDWIWLI